MPDATLSSDLDAFVTSANDAAARTELGLTTLATTTPGTGVATALAINIGSAGAPVLFNGALGTPSSGVATNLTGTAAGLTAGAASAVAVGGITGLGANVGAFLATPSSANLAAAVTGETGTGALVFGSSPTIDAPTLTGTTTAATVNATTVAATNATFGGATVAVRPAVKQTAVNYTIGTTDPNELYGGVIYVTAAATITIPAVAAGASFTVITVGAVAVSVDPNAADLIVLDGVALSDGDKITNLSTAGDMAVFTYYDATGWAAQTNGWTDTN